MNCTNYPASKKNILSSVLIMKNKDKDNLPKDKTTVITSRGYYYELPYGLSKELNSVTKQSFNHSCPVGFDGCCSSVAAMNFPCFLPKKSFQCLCANLILPFYVGVGEGKTHFLLCFNILNYKPHQEELSPFGIVTPSTRQTIQNLHWVQSWSLGDIESSPLGLDMVPLGCGLVCRKRGFELFGKR